MPFGRGIATRTLAIIIKSHGGGVCVWWWGGGVTLTRHRIVSPICLLRLVDVWELHFCDETRGQKNVELRTDFQYR